MQQNLRGTKSNPPIEDGAMRDEDSLWARLKDAAKTLAVRSFVLVVVYGLLLVGLRHAYPGSGFF